MIAGQYLDLPCPTQPAGDDVAGAERAARRPAQVRPLHGHPPARARRRAGRRRTTPCSHPLLGPTATRSASRSSCATTCSACSATEPATGKSALDDLREGKRTLLVLRAIGSPTGDQRGDELRPPARRSRARRRRRGALPRDHRRQRCAGLGRGADRRRGRRGRRTRWRDVGRAGARGAREPARRSLHRPGLVIDDGRRRHRRRAGRPVRRLPPAGAGHDVTVVEAGAVPGGRAGTLALGGYRFDTGPTVLTMPRPRRAVLRRGRRRRWPTTSRCCPVDPMYRATASPTAASCASATARGDGRGDPRGVRPGGGGRRSTASATGSPTSTRVEMPQLHRAQLRLAARPAAPAPAGAPAAAPRRLPPARRRRCGASSTTSGCGGIFSFQAMYAGLAPHEALALYAVITYMDAVNGVFVPVGGMHALPVGLAAAAAAAGVDVPLRRAGRADRAGQRHRRAGPRRAAGRRRGDHAPTRWSAPPTSRSPTARCCRALERPRRLRRGHYSPSALVWHVGVAATLPAGHRPPQHPLRPRLGRARSAPLLRDGQHDARPVAARHRADARRAGDGAARAARALRPRAGAEPRRPRSTGRAERRRVPATTCAPTVERSRLPDRRRGRGARRPARTGRPRAWSGARRSRSSHRFLQTGPFRPANVERRGPGLVFAGSAPCPGVGVPMVLVSGELAARPARGRVGRRAWR